MKKISHFLPILLLIVILSSCKKDDSGNQTPTTYPDFGQLKPGNYWVYQQFRIDTLGNETALNVFDSCYVEKDTLINGNIYHKVFRPSIFPGNDIGYWRDSLHYIVTSSGKVVFSSQDFASVFDLHYITANTDTIAKVITKMDDKNLMVSTPIGNFITSNYKVSYNMYPAWSFNGSKRNINVRYAENVGIVIETLPFYASDPNYTERRLVRVHLN
jgi:hypothetical protein